LRLPAAVDPPPDTDVAPEAPPAVVPADVPPARPEPPPVAGEVPALPAAFVPAVGAAPPFVPPVPAPLVPAPLVPPAPPFGSATIGPFPTLNCISSEMAATS